MFIFVKINYFSCALLRSTILFTEKTFLPLFPQISRLFLLFFGLLLLFLLIESFNFINPPVILSLFENLSWVSWFVFSLAAKLVVVDYLLFNAFNLQLFPNIHIFCHILSIYSQLHLHLLPTHLRLYIISFDCYIMCATSNTAIASLFNSAVL